jgi:hypothetical protein
LPRIRRLVVYQADQHSSSNRNHQPFHINDTFLRNLLNSLGRSAPILEHLEMTFRDSPFVNATLPDNVFGGEGGTPRLQSISLFGCGFSWHLPLFRTVTSLHVSHPIFSIGPNDLASVLSNIPNLKEVELASVFTPLPGRHTKVPSPQLVPSGLARLSISQTDIANCTLFLSSFTPHSMTRVTISCHVHPQDGDDSAVLSLQNMFTCIDRTVRRPILGMVITEEDARAWTKDGDSLLFFDIYPVLLNTRWQVLTLPHLKVLRADDASISCADWAIAFGNLEALQHIEVYEKPFEFLGAFTRGIFSPVLSPVRPGKLLFRRLRRLSIKHWNFSQQYHGERLIDILKNCLKERRRRGLGLHILNISNCYHLGDGDIKELELLVDRLVVEKDEKASGWDEGFRASSNDE